MAELGFGPLSTSLGLCVPPSTWCCLPGCLGRHRSLGVCLGGPLGQAAKVASRNSCLFSCSWTPAGRSRQTGSALLICFNAQMKEAMLTGAALAFKAAPARGPTLRALLPSQGKELPLVGGSHSGLKSETRRLSSPLLPPEHPACPALCWHPTCLFACPQRIL